MEPEEKQKIQNVFDQIDQIHDALDKLANIQAKGVALLDNFKDKDEERTSLQHRFIFWRAVALTCFTIFCIFMVVILLSS